MCISQQNNVYPPKKGGDTYTCVLSLIHIHTHPFSYLELGHVYDVYNPIHTHHVYDVFSVLIHMGLERCRRA